MKTFISVIALFGIVLAATADTALLPAVSKDSFQQKPTEGISVLGDWQVSHPHWNGSLTIRADGTFARPHGDGGRWVLGGDPDRPLLILRWNAWGTESVAMMTPDYLRGGSENNGMELRRLRPGTAPAGEMSGLKQNLTAQFPHSDNLLQAIRKPANQQREFIKTQADKLAQSRVPTPEAARELANQAFIKKPGMDAREGTRVVGLYRAGRGIKDFAKERDLVWEVQVCRVGSGISGIIWISTTTKKAKVLFPEK